MWCVRVLFVQRGRIWDWLLAAARRIGYDDHWWLGGGGGGSVLVG